MSVLFEQYLGMSNTILKFKISQCANKADEKT